MGLDAEGNKLSSKEKSLSQRLIEANLISAEEMEYVVERHKTNGAKLEDILIEQGLVTHEDMAMVMGLETDVPFVDLKRRRIDPRAAEKVPEVMARRYTAMPVEIVDDTLVVVMADTDNLQAIQDLAAQTRMRIQPAIGVAEDIQTAIDIHYKVREEVQKEISQVKSEALRVEAVESRISADLIAQAPIVRAVDLIIGQAVKDRASDIHIEPQEDRVRVRYRIDGMLHEMMSLPLDVHAALTSRLKILADMNIAERRRPQDGQFTAKVGAKAVDIRAATVDTIYGEKIVLRVLDKSLAFLPLSDLGFLPEPLAKYREMLKTPYGMILIAGPTGSGKTTTQYASINELDRHERHIITIEDPVEYRFQDITPIQVNPKAGLTFATGLRAIMRLDPDVMLVGEIRDTETAKIAIQSALTGHLVLSSVHANDAVGVLFRLADLGVETFLISSGLIGVVAQRMVRRVCSHCRVLSQATQEERMAFQQEINEDLKEYYKGEGCNLCANTGYLGRTGVHEVMLMSDEIRRALLTGANASDIRKLAIKEGMLTMRHDGLLKVKQAVTTPYEVLRNVFSIGGVQS